MGWKWDPNAQCPERGPALTHIRDDRVHPDGRCLYCGLGADKKSQEKRVVCSGFACIELTKNNGNLKEYCDNCNKIRKQHVVSHNWEGHSKPIRMCGVCEMMP